MLVVVRHRDGTLAGRRADSLLVLKIVQKQALRELQAEDSRRQAFRKRIGGKVEGHFRRELQTAAG